MALSSKVVEELKPTTRDVLSKAMREIQQRIDRQEGYAKSAALDYLRTESSTPALAPRSRDSVMKMDGQVSGLKEALEIVTDAWRVAG